MVDRSTVAKVRKAGRELFSPEPCIDLYAPVDPDRAREIAEASRAIGVRAVQAGPGRLQIDHELELARPYDRQIGRRSKRGYWTA